MTKEEQILEIINAEYEKNKDTSGSKTMNKVARRVFPQLPVKNTELIKVFDFLVTKNEWKFFWLVTKWIKRKELYDLKYMPYYERWLYDHINSWGSCDVFCYRVLNPMFERYPQIYKKIMKWAESSKTYVRRAAPVSLLESTRSFRVNCSISKVFMVAEKLKHDNEMHVQKGVGWLLKYAYLSYPDQVYNYLKENVDNLPRVIFRYALEKAPEQAKDELMSL